ncbi:MAG: glycosyltransferase family 4 protein [Planctomycetota bacterium]
MSEPLGVAYLTGLFARSSDTFIRQEVNQLRRLGIDVRTFSIRRPDAGPDVDADVLAHQRDTEYLLEAGPVGLLAAMTGETLRRPLAALRTARLAWKTRPPGLRGVLRQAVCLVESALLAKRLRQECIDLLHNHIGENSATVAMLASEWSGVPFSLTIHGPGIFFAPEWWALGDKLSRAAFTACITDYCRSQCMVFTPPEAWPRLHVVRCAVPEAFLEEEPSTTPPANPPTFVCVGRLCPEKAQRLLVEAAAALASDGHAFRVVLIGDGPDRAMLESVANELGVASLVEFAGWGSSADVHRRLRAARALVSCSFAEGLPIVLMEAYAAGCPVIATRIAATYELVESNATGWLIPPADTAALTDALRAALEAPAEQLAAYATEGRRRVEERHHPAKQAERLAELMRSPSF